MLINRYFEYVHYYPPILQIFNFKIAVIKLNSVTASC